MDIFISIIALVGFVALTAATGVFVAVEFALTSLERSTVENRAAAGTDPAAAVIKRAHQHLSFELSGAQLGITITTLATGYLAEPVLSKFFNPLLGWAGLSEHWAGPTAAILALIVATTLSMVYGELVPKNMAITDPWRAATLTVRPVQWFNRIFKWFILALNASANALVRKLGIEPADELASARSPQELGALVRVSADQGGIDESKAQVIESSLKFGETSAEEIMTPRSTIEYLQADDTAADLLALAERTGYSRFPVTEGDLDVTIGIVQFKEAFAIPPAEREHTKLATLARKVPMIPDSLDGDSVLTAVRSAGSQVVLVADEYGGTAGIITIEDVVEEILGEFYDEHDDIDSERDFMQVGSSWVVAGLARVDDLPDVVGYHAPEGPYDTVGGLVMASLGAIPSVSDVVLLPEAERHTLEEFTSDSGGRWIAQVTIMDGRRVDRVVLTPVSDEEASQYRQPTRPGNERTERNRR